MRRADRMSLMNLKKEEKTLFDIKRHNRVHYRQPRPAANIIYVLFSLFEKANKNSSFPLKLIDSLLDGAVQPFFH